MDIRVVMAARWSSRWGLMLIASALILCAADGASRSVAADDTSSTARSDELGSAAVEDRYHVKNLHATVLHQLGMDPNRLTYFYAGLNQKLVGVEGAEPIRQVISA